MALRNILTVEEPVLHKTARPVTRFDAHLGELLDDMRQTLTNAGGVGLAAPQIGILRRVVVVDDDGELIELAGNEDRHGIIGRLLLRLRVELRRVLHDDGAAVRAVFCGNGVQLLHDEAADALFAAERLFQLDNLGGQRVDLLRSAQNVFLVDVAQLDLRHELRLHLVDAEADHQVRHDLRLGLRLADDADGLVDVQQDLAQALKQVELFALFALLEEQAAADALRAPGRPLLDDLAYAHHARHARDENVEITGEAVLQRR